jgi:hypothetical protein
LVLEQARGTASVPPVTGIALKSLVSHLSGSGDHNISTRTVWREGFRPWTALPKGVSVVSNSRFISGVRRDGTYQLSASDNT